MAKIMIVEDNEHMHRIYADKFRREGYAVVDAFNGEEAVTLASREKPDVILLDLMMPVMDGYEVMKRLKADPQTSPIPLLVISNKSQPVDIERALMLGARNFFHKGMTLLDDLALTARRLCHLKKALIVSSRHMVIEPIRQRLAPTGFILSTSGIAVETVARAERESPDIIFLDTQLPGQNLNHLLQRLSLSPKAKAIPVVIIGPVALGEVALSNTQVVGYMTVPIEGEKLDEVVRAAGGRQVQAAAA
jgi:CheY-like chemotaxis protein